jgi:putative transposase
MDVGPHRNRLRRVDAVGHVRFLTFSCYRRLPLLDHDAIRILFLERLQVVTREYDVRLLAWVIMPEHVHLLLFPEGPPRMAQFVHALKRPVAEAVLRRWKELDAPILQKLSHAGGYRYWQAGGGYDRNLFNEAAVLEKANYIHENPVRRNLARVATDYPWSSARWYAGLRDAKLPCDAMPF